MSSRFANAWCGALLALVAAATLELFWITAASPSALNEVRSWLVAFGLMLPVAALLALALAGAARAWIIMKPAPAAGATPRFARLGLLSSLALCTWLGLAAQLAWRVLSADLPPLAVAALLALTTALLARIGWGAALALEAWLERAGRRSANARRASLAMLAGVLVFTLPLAYGIATGSTNGEGGLWGVFGVFRRPELDLRAPALGSVLLAGGWLGLHFRIARRAFLGFASAAALLAFGATSFRFLDDVPLAIALDRGGTLSRASARALRSVSDRDGDGASPLFGGRDCNDTQGDVFPGAIDVPGNGRDEDCSGADAEPLQAPPEPAVEPAAASAAAPRVQVPADLNVILITVDTLRYDLGYTGYPRAISVHLDRLAQQSSVFERAYALASYTGKSIGPMLIGKYPSETNRGWLHFNRFGKDETFVQERLQAAGIRTLSVQGHWYFTPEYGLGRGFDVLDVSAMPRERQREGDKTVNSDAISNAVIARLSDPANVAGRFFLWAHYLDPHAEYIRHAGFDFGNRGRDLYDSEVAFTDQQIGRVLSFVAASDFAAKTAIVVTSDHGEAFGEHGMYRHGFELWEALVRVPLIIYVPGVEARRVAVRRSAIDLCPTLLELFGLPVPSGEERLSGKSLVPDLFAAPGAALEQRPIFIDMSAGPFNEERQALIDSDIKLIMSSGRAIGLYDLGKDPEEKEELVGNRELVQRARERFETFRRGLRLVNVKPR